MQNQKVRVRIAPSPTGDPHVGTAYVALFNYAFARKNGGKFVLRIEDTDRNRSKSSSEAMIQKSLRWLGLDWDEGPDVGGDFGPYTQSERLGIYREHVESLVAKGRAYCCFCTSEDLDKMRADQKAKGLMTGYDRRCRDLEPDTVERRKNAGDPYVIRLKMPIEGTIKFQDHLRGEVEIDAKQLDDQVLLKTDGFPTYHLANVVDDKLMEISHVIRAEEWISSTPKHTILYQAFGWPEPVWVHLPLLRNSDKSKISKRKNPVSLEYYRRAGILPEALVNYLSLMGWSFGGDREIFTLEEMIDVFDLKNISLGGPVFDQTKLTWVNQTYMHQMSDESFVKHIKDQIFSDDYLLALKPLVLERMSRFEQFVDNNRFFFNGALDYSQVALIPKSKEAVDIRKMVKELAVRMDELYEWRAEQIGELLGAFKDELGWKPRDFFMTIRLIATGRKDSPPLPETLEALGREIVRFRLRDVINAGWLK